MNTHNFNVDLVLWYSINDHIFLLETTSKILIARGKCKETYNENLSIAPLVAPQLHYVQGNYIAKQASLLLLIANILD